MKLLKIELFAKVIYHSLRLSLHLGFNLEFNFILRVLWKQVLSPTLHLTNFQSKSHQDFQLLHNDLEKHHLPHGSPLSDDGR